MNDRSTAAAVYERIEAYALAGARDDQRPDKSSWIRIWAVARRCRGQSADADAWTAAYAAGYKREEQR